MRYLSIVFVYLVFDYVCGASTLLRQNTPACPKGQHLCGTVCANLIFDRKNCGACGNACAIDEVCARRKCKTVTCTNVIDCANGVSGGQVHCGAAPIPKTARCACVDVDGSPDAGICTLVQSCEDPSICANSSDCGDGFICSLRSCCSVPEGMGICLQMYSIRCANPSSTSQIFKVSDGGVKSGSKMSDGS